MTDINEITKQAKRTRRMARGPKPADAKEVTAPSADGDQATTLSRLTSKASLVLQLLKRPEGATIAQLVTATGWLPHTTRAALTRLKKKGLDVTSSKEDGEQRVYRAVAA